MNKVVESSWQSWLVALGLLIMIPVTIRLGMNFMAPKVDWKQYSTLRAEYFKNCRSGQDEKIIDYEKCDMDWQVSDAQKQYEQQVQSRSKFEAMVSGPLVFALIVAGSFINGAIIAAAFIGSAVLVHFFYAVSVHTLGQATMIIVLQLVMALLSLGLVLWRAYRSFKD